MLKINKPMSNTSNPDARFGAFVDFNRCNDE